jgi:diguanylate cyclase (GGDEF)-like protein
MVITATFTLLIVGVFAWHLHELHQTKNVTQYLSTKTQADFKKLLELKADKIRTFCSENTLWDELYLFPKKPNKKWAHDSFVSVFSECNADAYYIFDRKGQLLFHENAGSNILKDFVPPDSSWKTIFEFQGGIHRVFFNSPAGLAEMQVATIHRTEDSGRNGPYSGYLAIVKVWTPEYVNELGTWIEASVQISSRAQPNTSTSDGFRFSAPLEGSRKQPIAYLNVHVVDKTISKANLATNNLTKSFLIYSLGLFAIVIGAVALMVCRPLGTISRSLKNDDRSELVRLIRRDDEFGRISVLIDDVLRHREDLKKLSTDLEDFIQQQKLQIEGERYDDPLTLLHNRTYYKERLDSLMAEPSSYSRLAIIFIDIDDFQVINDTLDMFLGDELLKEIANRLRILIPEPADLVRFGGDEFSIIYPMQSEKDELEPLLTSIQDSIKYPFTLSEQTVHCSISLGVACYTSEELETVGANITKHAGLALRHAKISGKNRYTFYQEGMQETIEERALTESVLREAIDKDEFEIYYQPIVGIENGDLHSVEALVRWAHPTRGIISPAEFIPLAEQTGLVIPIGYSVLRKACKQIHDLWEAHPECPKFILSVNLSGKQVDEPDVIARIKAILEETQFNAEFLQLEVTETAMAQNLAESIVRLKALRYLGITIAIDDFGTGYSSISSLGDLPANIVKVDMCFVRRLPDDIEAISILRAIASMSASVGLKTVAEGIENSKQLEILAILGYHYGQGFLFAQPLPIDQLEQLTVERPDELHERVMSAYANNDSEAA